MEIVKFSLPLLGGSREVNVTKKWCVYTHHRPDSTTFYVGKGVVSRAFEFCRRNKHHQNIVAKHGKPQLTVSLCLVDTELRAFELEKKYIALCKELGIKLANYTDGGEGCAGKKPSAKQLAGLAKGRLPGKRTAQGSLDAIAAGRKQLLTWRATEEGKVFLRYFSALGKKNLASWRRPHKVRCAECGIVKVRRNGRAKFCGRYCEQVNRRDRQRGAA